MRPIQESAKHYGCATSLTYHTDLHMQLIKFPAMLSSVCIIIMFGSFLVLQLPLLQDALSEFAKFEAELKVKSSHLSNLRVDISNPTASLAMLKGKYPTLPLFTLHWYLPFRQVCWREGISVF